ncbi:MAG: hypothetical protein V3V78_04700 [Candidatus Woesearchaeota archaeon]
MDAIESLGDFDTIWMQHNPDRSSLRKKEDLARMANEFLGI